MIIEIIPATVSWVYSPESTLLAENEREIITANIIGRISVHAIITNRSPPSPLNSMLSASCDVFRAKIYIAGLQTRENIYLRL